jgi:transcriptional regulator with XRE-family HTH domain
MTSRRRRRRPREHTIGDVIRTMRERRGLSQRDLASNARVSQPYLAQLENGTRKRPAFDIVVKIARGLGLSLDELSALVSRE